VKIQDWLGMGLIQVAQPFKSCTSSPRGGHVIIEMKAATFWFFNTCEPTTLKSVLHRNYYYKCDYTRLRLSVCVCVCVCVMND